MYSIQEKFIYAVEFFFLQTNSLTVIYNKVINLIFLIKLIKFNTPIMEILVEAQKEQ